MTGEPPWDLLTAAALLLANRFIGPGLLRRRSVYYVLQAIDIAAIAWFVVVGVGGLQATRVPGMVIAGLFAMHMVMNASRRGRLLDADPRPPWRRPPPV